jgi:hypothetical protein
MLLNLSLFFNELEAKFLINPVTVMNSPIRQTLASLVRQDILNRSQKWLQSRKRYHHEKPLAEIT